MKKIIVLLILILATPALAGTWCQWDGSKGVNCRGVSGDRFRLPSGVWVAQKDFNEYGYYERITTNPVLGENQVRDQEVWGFADNQISLTWTVRDLTAAEIDQRAAGAMDLATYLIFRLLVNKSVTTNTELRTYMETKYPELADAYEARDRLENP